MNEPPKELVEEINRGNCVAFIGAGFSAAANVPRWVELLQKIAESLEAGGDLRQHVDNLGPEPPAHALDQAAQMLADRLQGRFVERLHEIVKEYNLTEIMKRRLEWVRQIPFRAILSTNFDGILPGDVPNASIYRRILRNEPTRWWQPEFWDTGQRGAPTLHIHGDASREKDHKIVFTREDYRRRLYSDPAYMTFLRSILSTSTVLYFGFSFTDAYLNELRSEILALFGHSTEALPVAYAILNDVNEVTERHFLAHEGIRVLAYNSKDPPDHGGFDDWLQKIHAATSPLSRLGALLRGKRILWVDPSRDNNTYGFHFLGEAARATNHELKPIETAGDPDEALARLGQAQAEGQAFDLVITHWGRADQHGAPPGERLLSGIRARDLRVPVIIFAGTHDAEERRRKALSLGAQAYCFRFETLFRRIEDIFASASNTW